ncbi:MAG: response regulator [Pseudomonadota bacterium]
MEQYKVLVIEDDETARGQLAKAIRKEGYEVVVAEDGRAGVELFKKELPEIVVSDLKMPGIDGMEVMHTVRRLSKNTQIILVTAFGETDTVISALREGALDYLKKPLDLDQLTVALGRAKEKVMEYKKGATFPALLLADDEEKIRERLARVLEKEGWKVFQVADGEEAINVFKDNRIDVVLLDIKMPKKNGLEALHEMRSVSNDFEAIILTGYGDENSAIQALRDGAINFLKKPIDLEQMILAVQKAMEKLKSDRALKYRTRELELANQIIGIVTAENELLIDLRRHIPEPAKDFAQQLLDAIPIYLFVLDEDLKVLYINRPLARAIKYQPERLDEEFLKSLARVGIKGLSSESLLSVVNKISEAPHGTIETLSTGKYSFITFAPVRVLIEGEEKKTVLAIIRGERG